MENNQTINWKKQVNDRIKKRTVQAKRKRVNNFKYIWYDRLTEAAKCGPAIYQKVRNDLENAYHEMKKGPALKLDEIKVKPL